MKNAGSQIPGQSIFRHYNTNVGTISSEELLSIPTVVENGELTPKQEGKRRLMVYKYSKDGVEYTVVTERKEGKEVFNDFYTNRKASSPASFNTPEGARSTRDNASSGAKVQQNTETTKDSEEKVREHRVYHGSGADFKAFDHSHMGEGEGAQSYGWGSYVTEVEGIGRTYAQQGRGKYTYKGKSWEKLWHGEHDAETMAALDVMENLERGYSFDDAVATARKAAEKSVQSFNGNPAYQSSAVHYEERIEALDNMSRDDFARKENILYTVEIPDDNGSNYLEWDKVYSYKELEDILNRLPENAKEEYGSGDFEGVGIRNYSEEDDSRYVTGEGIYKIFSNEASDMSEFFPADQQKASDILHKAGFTGIKYPADYQRGGRADGAKNYVVFDEDDLKITDKLKFFRTPDGEAYGYTYKGKIYLDPRIATSETPIHEYTHLWAEAIRKTDAEKWKQIVDLLRNDEALKPIWERMKADYPELKNEDDIAEEVLAQYSGKQGAERLRAEAERISQEQGEKAGKTFFEKIREALESFWQSVAEKLGISGYKTAGEIADRVMKDLFEGKNPLEGVEAESRVKGHFIGSKGAAALDKVDYQENRMENRRVAEEMEKAGKDAEAIELSAKRWRRRKDEIAEDEEDMNDYSAKEVYHERLNTIEYVTTESFQDDKLGLKTGQNAIAQDKEIPDSQNAYQAMNLSFGKTFNEQEQFKIHYKRPLIATCKKIRRKMGWRFGDIDRYLFTKHGFERNRELFVRDWLDKQRGKKNADTDALSALEQQYIDLKQENFEKMLNGKMTFPEYLAEIDDFIRANIDKGYDAAAHDYSGFTEMFGDEDGNFDEAEILADLMADEERMGDDLQKELWNQVNMCSQYGLEKYRETGMMSEQNYKKVTNMFHWYVPMRGFQEGVTSEEHWQYMTSRSRNTIGGLLRHAKGRRSKAGFPLATLFGMTDKAISDGNQNEVKKYLWRLCQANKNDLVVLSDVWAVQDPVSGEWTTAYPETNSDMTSAMVDAKVREFNERMKDLEKEGKAKKVKGNAQFDYRVDPSKKGEHVVEVRINGDRKMMVVTGNPRLAQALNRLLEYKTGNGVRNRLVSNMRQRMQSLSTSYSLKFVHRNLSRDWTHFSGILTAREGLRYTGQAEKYYFETLPRPGKKGRDGMVGLFRKWRAGELDMSVEVERDFKDFMDSGGNTGFVHMQKVEKYQKEMEKLTSGKMNLKKIKADSKVWECTFGALEAFNEAIENNARFATYRASRHYAGRTKARSAYDAKEVTVNFNKKGAGIKTADFKSDKKGVERAAKLSGGPASC